MVPIANYYSVGTTNHAASISSATLVTPSGTIPNSNSNSRRAAAISEAQEEEEEEEEEQVVRKRQIEEEGEVEEPPRDQVVEREVIRPKSVAVEEVVPTVQIPIAKEEVKEVTEIPEVTKEEAEPVVEETKEEVEEEEEELEEISLKPKPEEVVHSVPTIEVSSPESTDNLASSNLVKEVEEKNKKVDEEEDDMEEIGL